MSTRRVVLGALLLLALALALFGDKTPWQADGPAISEAVTPVSGGLRASASATPTGTDDPRLRSGERPAATSGLRSRSDWLSAEGPTAVADPFSARKNPATANPPAPAPAPRSAAAVPVVVETPGPEAGWAVLGKQFDGEHWAVFLSKGRGLWVARVGDTVDASLTVETIAPPTMTLRHRETGEVARLQIGAAP